jgi:3',5'-cyclic AMP phosphodiesterase CpdA
MKHTASDTKPRSITILHISDMQFGKYHRFVEKNGGPPNPRDTLATRLIDDLDHLRKENGLYPDLIICTGDLAEWGMAKEFTEAFAFLGKLCDHCALQRSRCIVIPGNHDINRSSCEAYFNECKADDTTPKFPWIPKWKHFKAAFDDFYVGFSHLKFDVGTPWSLFVDEDLHAVVAGFNSTMDEGHDAAVNAGDPKGHHGLCTEEQLNWFKQRLTEARFNGWLRIGAVHHNTNRGCRNDDEYLRDADLLGGLLASHLHLLLHGHTHQAKADVLATKLRVYSTGSASLTTNAESRPIPTDVPNQYQFLVVQRRSITRFCRQYDPSSWPPAFIADPRHSWNKNDWIVTDDVDFADVIHFSDEVEAKNPTEKNSDSSAPASQVIPTPPDFYAEPDYIGLHQFVGRESELQQLSDWAKSADPTNLLLFEAIGGNGKSMLTWEWVNNQAIKVRSGNEQWAGRFWYSFYEKGAIMADFCRRALAYMTGRPLEEFAKKKTAALAPDLLAQLHAKPWLLILDGLERVLVAYHRIDAAEVLDEEANAPTDKIVDRNPCDAIRDEDNDLLRAFAAAKPSKILVSSRLTPRVLLNPAGQTINGAKRISLSGLRPSDAEQLLRSCGIGGDSAAIQRYLTENCDNHPLVIGVLAGLIQNYLPSRGNFDAWVSDPAGGAKLDLANLDLIQRRNHILRAALDVLPPASRQLLSTIALLSDSVDYETLKAFNPHLPPEPEEVGQPILPEKLWRWEEHTEEEKAAIRERYNRALERREEYERAVEAKLASAEYREAPGKLTSTVTGLEQRGLLQYDRRVHRYDLHPVVRAVVAGWMQTADKERYGQRVVDYFSSLAQAPYEQAESLEDLRAGLNVVRTLAKLGHLQAAAEAYRSDLANALLFNLEAPAEILPLLRPFFATGWSKVPAWASPLMASYLMATAGIALSGCGEAKQAMSVHGASLVIDLHEKAWFNAITSLLSISSTLTSQNLLGKAHSIADLSSDFSEALGDKDQLFITRLSLFWKQILIGQSAAADATWELLDPMGRKWPRQVYLAGEAEWAYAAGRFWAGSLEEEHLIAAERLATEGKSRPIVRYLFGLRGEWRLSRGEWGLAATSFSEALRMARESGIADANSDTGLALAKCHLGELLDPYSEAARLAGIRDPSDRLLAELWLAIGDEEQAKEHAITAYKWAWADGEPYVNRYELTKTSELLTKMGVPVPNFPPYDPAKDEKFPWEDDVRAAIEKLRAEKEERELRPRPPDASI